MRTSHLQYVTMVEFMEANGDLSKPSGGPRGRNFIQCKWKELANKLNSDGTGDPRSEEKWRKVWSDYKNNCKKKYAKINKAASGTGGGPALQLSLTDLENRVMQIIVVQAATGMGIEEAGFQQDVVSETPHQDPQAAPIEAFLDAEVYIEDWNTPGTSSQPTVAPPLPPPEAHSQPSPIAPVEEEWKPPPRKKAKNSENIIKKLIDSDTIAMAFARERDRVYEEMEKERLRLNAEELRIREYDIRERVRQRDVELELQGAWLEFMRKSMELLEKYLDKKN